MIRSIPTPVIFGRVGNDMMFGISIGAGQPQTVLKSRFVIRGNSRSFIMFQLNPRHSHRDIQERRNGRLGSIVLDQRLIRQVIIPTEAFIVSISE